MSGRDVAKRVGFGLSVLLAAAWGVSIFFSVGYSTADDESISARKGCLSWGRFEGPPDELADFVAAGELFRGWHVRSQSFFDGRKNLASFGIVPPSDESTGDWQNPNITIHITTLPLWLPFLLFALPTAYLWCTDFHRAKPGHCITCKHNMTGNDSGKCPECGTPLKPADTPKLAELHDDGKNQMTS